MTGAVRPLAGLKVAITRPEQAADEFHYRLASAGATPLSYPLIRIEPRDDGLTESARRLPVYDWVVFTSATAVRRLAEVGCHDGHVPDVAVVGKATAAAVRSVLGWPVTAMPERFTGDEVVAAMAAHEPLRGRRVLWPRAAGARPIIAAQLAAAGALLDAPVAYGTVVDREAVHGLRARALAGAVDVITFTSPSAVHAYMSGGAWPGGVRTAVIGPVTAAACARHGIPVHVMAPEHTIAALVHELEQDNERGTEHQGG